MARKEFSKQTKRDALHRAEGKCEAVGDWYGLEPGERCNAPLGYGVEFDHADLEVNSRDNSLKNCVACCIKCHRWKTNHRDKQIAAKTQAQQDKHNNTTTYKPPMAGSRKSGWKKPMRGPAVRR